MTWRADCSTCDLVCSPPASLFIVGFVFLIQMASFIQRTHLFVSLSTTFAPSQSITQLCEGRRWWLNRRSKLNIASCVIMKFVSKNVTMLNVHVSFAQIPAVCVGRLYQCSLVAPNSLHWLSYGLGSSSFHS